MTAIAAPRRSADREIWAKVAHGVACASIAACDALNYLTTYGQHIMIGGRDWADGSVRDPYDVSQDALDGFRRRSILGWSGYERE